MQTNLKENQMHNYNIIEVKICFNLIFFLLGNYDTVHRRRLSADGKFLIEGWDKRQRKSVLQGSLRWVALGRFSVPVDSG